MVNHDADSDSDRMVGSADLEKYRAEIRTRSEWR